jgi:hypothetical protein
MKEVHMHLFDAEAEAAPFRKNIAQTKDTPTRICALDFLSTPLTNFQIYFYYWMAKKF